MYYNFIIRVSPTIYKSMMTIRYYVIAQPVKHTVTLLYYKKRLIRDKVHTSYVI